MPPATFAQTNLNHSGSNKQQKPTKYSTVGKPYTTMSLVENFSHSQNAYGITNTIMYSNKINPRPGDFFSKAPPLENGERPTNTSVETDSFPEYLYLNGVMQQTSTRVTTKILDHERLCFCWMLTGTLSRNHRSNCIYSCSMDTFQKQCHQSNWWIYSSLK